MSPEEAVIKVKQNNAHNTYKAYHDNRTNRKNIQFIVLKLTFNPPAGTRTQVNKLLRVQADRWAKHITDNGSMMKQIARH